MMARIAGWLDEATMGFLALAALCVAFVPGLFDLPPQAARLVDAAEWVIVAIFALEYAAHLAVARERLAFALDPWRVLDLAIVLLALASVLPFVSDAARASPVLRIARLLRALLFGARAGYGLRHAARAEQRLQISGPPRVSRAGPQDAAPRPATWEDLISSAASPLAEWLHASNLTPQRLAEVAAAAGVPHVMLEAALHEASYPRLETGGRWTALTLSLPPAEPAAARSPMLLLVREGAVLSLALQPLEQLRPPPALPAGPAWGAGCALEVMRRVLERDEALTGRMERATRELEAMPAGEGGQSFLERTFRLKHDLSVAKGNLWRLHGLLEMLADGRRALPGLDDAQRRLAGELAEEADYLYETVDGQREAVLSLIELHMNVAAHETNRFMRVLAIVTALSLIPALAGGLLGMNLADSPWPVTLGQVAFGTLVVMLATLYAFLAKGWIR